MEIRVVSPLREDVAVLLQQALTYAANLYPGGSNHTEDANQLSRPNVHFVGAFERQELVGIGAVKRLDDDGVYGEIKSLFVLPKARGLGVAGRIMQVLEDHLRAHDIDLVRLETGVVQTAAIALYHRLGYQDREPFGAYKPDRLSLFMEKSLVGPGLS